MSIISSRSVTASCFDDTRVSMQDNEKYSVMTPFNVSHKILGPYLFAQTARESFGDKMELYFHDMSLVPLFIQVREKLASENLWS